MGNLRLPAGAGLAFALLAVLTVQCGGSSVTTIGGSDASMHACIPGASMACAGPGGCAGFQVCASDGSGLGPCDCGGGQSSSSGSDATVGASGSTSSSGGGIGPIGCGSSGCAIGSSTSSGGSTCVPGARICNGGSVDICSSAGQWQFLTSCPGSCTGGACVAQSGSSSGGGVCTSNCLANLDCQQTCPAPGAGSVNCCDLISGTCFITRMPACPGVADGAPE